MHPGSAQLKSQNASLILHVPVFSSCLKLILNFFFWIGISASSVMGFLFVCLFFWKINHSLNISLSLPLIFFFTFLSCLLFPQEVVHSFFSFVQIVKVYVNKHM